LRASVPLAEQWEVELAGNYRYLLLQTKSSSSSPRSASVEATLMRYDSRGAFYLQARLPLFTTQAAQAQTSNILGKSLLSGSLTLDDVAAWSVFFGRDLTFGKKAHLRAGLGYVREPGIIVIDSYGNLLAKVDVYWR
jgi:hypothetical protein